GQAGDHGAAAEIDLLGALVGEFLHIGGRAGREHAAMGDRDRLSHGEILVHRDDLAVIEHGVSGVGGGRGRGEQASEEEGEGAAHCYCPCCLGRHVSILRNSAFATFSKVERGISSTKRISRGTLKSASPLRQAVMTLSCRSFGSAAMPACGMMKATGTSSSIGCGLPTTAVSRTPGTTAITCSISEAATFSAPTLSMSLARSENLR